MRQLGITTFQKTDTLCPCFRQTKQKKKDTIYDILKWWVRCAPLLRCRKSIFYTVTSWKSESSSFKKVSQKQYLFFEWI